MKVSHDYSVQLRRKSRRCRSAYELEILKQGRTVNSQRDEAVTARLVRIGRPSFDSRFECWSFPYSSAYPGSL
jgi:hypothetical protein